MRTKFLPSIALKRVSFEYLKLVSKCVEAKLKFLKKIQRYPTTAIKVIGEMVKEQLKNNYNAKYNYCPAKEIRQVSFDIEEGELIRRVKETIEKEELVLEEYTIAIIIKEVMILNTNSIGFYIENHFA